MKTLFILLMLLRALNSSVSFSADKNTGTIKNEIENIMQWEEMFGFSGSVLIVKDGEIILSKGYGFANKKQWFLNTPKTAFYIASVSKPITALAVMKLVEEKKIVLKDRITKYFVNVPEDKSGITVEMLLTHTSGFENTYSCDDISDRSEAIQTILNETSMIGAPGEKYNYSGDNYSLLAAIIEIVSGYKFETFVTEKILIPAGIDRPAFAGNLQLLNHEDIAAPSENAKYKNLKDVEASWGHKGRAGLILSVEDLYKLDVALDEQKILTPDIIKDIVSPKVKTGDGSSYGYGFTVANTARGTRVYGHNGDDDAIMHNAEYMNFPDEKVKIFITSNSGLYSGTSWSTAISSLLQRVLFESNYEYKPEELFYNEFQKTSPERLEKYEGVYRSGSTDFLVWIDNDQHLIVSPVGNEAARVFGYSDAYVKKNVLVKSILEETHDRKYSLLESNSKDNSSFEKMKSTISGLWQSLEKKNGPLKKIEILGTGNVWGGGYQSDIATWFKLHFENKVQQYRLEWDGNNKISGLGGSRIKYPMMFTLNAIAKEEFIGYDITGGRSIKVNFLSFDKDNKKRMELSAGGGKTLKLYNSGNEGVLPVRSAAYLLYSIIKTKGIPAAIEELNSIKEKKLNRFDVDEGELNEVGYELLKDEKINEAIAVFTILVQEFPESANGYDSLGEAYMNAGNKEEAIKNYEKSLSLDPKNFNAKKMIEKLNK